MLSVLGHLVEIYVETISSGEVPCLENAVVVLANLENQTAVQEALKVYQTGMEEVRHILIEFSCFVYGHVSKFYPSLYISVSLYKEIIPLIIPSEVRTPNFVYSCILNMSSKSEQPMLG